MATGGSQEKAIEKLEVGYWNVDWNWKGIEEQLDDIIDAMCKNNCDIVFCTDTRTIETEFQRLNVSTSYERPQFLEYPLKYKSTTTVVTTTNTSPTTTGTTTNGEYSIVWIEEKEQEKRKFPGGICVIWNESKIGQSQIKFDVIPVEEIKTGNDLEITKHRMLTAQISTLLGNVVFICCYVMTNNSKDDRYAGKFYEELQRVTDEVKAAAENKLLVVLGDMNGQIGEDEIAKLAKKAGWGYEETNNDTKKAEWKSHPTNEYHSDYSRGRQRFGFQGKEQEFKIFYANDRGKQFVDFCEKNKLTIASVLFPNKLCTYQSKWDEKTERNDNQTPDKKSQGDFARSDIDHFAIGWIDPDDNDITKEKKNTKEEENRSGPELKTVSYSTTAICTGIRVTQRSPKAEKEFHRLCIASMDFRKPNDENQVAEQLANTDLTDNTS